MSMTTRFSKKLSNKPLRRSPPTAQRIVNRRVIAPYGREIRVRGSVGVS
jgi:hypothetical protein